ncbi:MAG TPA: sn-glycerol-3-phosphate ABC transporter substrate-binding protein UgpB [Acetobacteraceae bacterium]|nr:sn-glycerol-3-phosphate ABC transporter substrate-binding protein UgpB [Acetobacteraceae bacterium]
MKRRTLLAGGAALAAAPLLPARAQGAKTHIVFWHAMTGALGDQVAKLVNGFNASQNAVEVEAVYKGGYADLLNATIAAYRAGQAPHIAQIFEVGTGTMLSAGKAVKLVADLIKEYGAPIHPDAYIPAVRGYYSLADGRMASMPFNSSTAIMWINRDAFRKAGLDPDKPPVTWDEAQKAAEAIKAKQAAEIPMISSWFSWIQLEQFSAIHNLPFASEENGFEGLNAKLEFNGKGQVGHIQRLLDMGKAGTFVYAGRDNVPDPILVGGKAGIAFNSSGERGDLVKSAKFDFGAAYLPYDPKIIKSPLNSIIGGASLWTMTAPSRTAAEYKAVGQFFGYLGTPENVAQWAEATGYVPVTVPGGDVMQKDGFFAKNKGADIPVKQLERGKMTPNSRGLRLGRLPEIRNIIYEEVEKAFQGQQDAQQALDNAVERGNAVLRAFERSVHA